VAALIGLAAGPVGAQEYAGYWLYSLSDFEPAGSATTGAHYMWQNIDSGANAYHSVVDTFNSDVLNLLSPIASGNDKPIASILLDIVIGQVIEADSARIYSADTINSIVFALYTSARDDKDVKFARQLWTGTITKAEANDTLHSSSIVPDTLSKYLQPYTWLRSIVTDSVGSTKYATAGTKDSTLIQVLLYLTAKTRDSWVR
jgi:hypothetical protein